MSVRVLFLLDHGDTADFISAFEAESGNVHVDFGDSSAPRPEIVTVVGQPATIRTWIDRLHEDVVGELDRLDVARSNLPLFDAEATV